MNIIEFVFVGVIIMMLIAIVLIVWGVWDAGVFKRSIG